MKVRYLPQPEWGVGHLQAILEEGTRAQVVFPTREEPTIVSTKSGALVPHQLSVGDRVRARGRTGAVTGEEPGGRGLRRYTLRYDDGEDDELPESELRALPPRPDLLALLREGRVGDARGFNLRKRALALDDERRCDALGALLASRVMVKPHQIGVVQRVLGARRPRFVLADEVGLGKTIEAGMIASALRLSGLANRVLVVAPSHLTVQWLAELFHKFNQLYTLMDGDRHESSLKEHPDRSPWARFDKVVTSLELLSRGDEHVAQAGAPDAFWDLVIIDEAHHLKGEKAFAAAQALAKNSWGMLLLTATPMQLDPDEYRGLLTLIDPSTAPDAKRFRERLGRQEELSEAVRALLEGKGGTKAVGALAKRFPGDDALKKLEGDALLAHLAETYSLSDRLLRNRRAIVGGFSERVLHRHVFEVPAAEKSARESALELLRTRGNLKGAPLASLLRRLESSSAALLDAVRTSRTLAPLVGELSLPARDSKVTAFLGVLKKIWSREPDAKVLVFTEARSTLEMLREQLSRENLEALVYHGDLPLLDRDRQVARFRDPDGPKVLLCTEVGGEGRNFQFAHHLVHYDLPWSPSAVEQRIGRLDRIGQTKPVENHVFTPKGSFSEELVTLFADAVGVFGETVGGLDAVLEEVEGRLSELALATPEERDAYAGQLAARVREARSSIRRAYDPLLDLRSFDKPAVEALVARALERWEVDAEEDDALEERLWAVARDLDERLEDTVTELARKVGIGVDTDEQVEAFQCALVFGHALNVEALPGLSILEDKTVLGTFWRDTAVEQEEIEYFATGHPVVEALFGFLRDGPFGRSGFRLIRKRATKARGIEFLFHLVPPEPDDTSPGARVPSRQLARFLDRWLVQVAVSEGADGKPRADPALLGVLGQEGEPVKGDAIGAAFPALAKFVDGAVAEANAAAEAERKVRIARARVAIEAERDGAVQRLRLALGHQGISSEQIDAHLRDEEEHYAEILSALDGVKVVLDSACAFVVAP
jgi:ATP-dependent helicase HepA